MPSKGSFETTLAAFCLRGLSKAYWTLSRRSITRIPALWASSLVAQERSGKQPEDHGTGGIVILATVAQKSDFRLPERTLPAAQSSSSPTKRLSAGKLSATRDLRRNGSLEDLGERLQK